jgi:hypothetical protein
MKETLKKIVQQAIENGCKICGELVKNRKCDFEGSRFLDCLFYRKILELKQDRINYNSRIAYYQRQIPEFERKIREYEKEIEKLKERKESVTLLLEKVISGIDIGDRIEWTHKPSTSYNPHNTYRRSETPIFEPFQATGKILEIKTTTVAATMRAVIAKIKVDSHPYWTEINRNTTCIRLNKLKR